MGRVWEECGGHGIHWNFSVPPNPNPHDDGDKVTTRDAHCGLHNEHLKKLGGRGVWYFPDYPPALPI